MTLLDVLRKRISTSGPLSIADYMEFSLSHPEFGYYMRKDPLGSEGDFITAPEISQIFGEMLGIWCADSWQKLGSPSPVIVVEPGPGRGTLMQDFLRATRHIPGFHAALSVHLIETSPPLRAIQQETLGRVHPSLHWHAEFDTLPEQPMLMVANEFFDVLPIRQYGWTSEGWSERLVTFQDGELTPVFGKPLRDPPVNYKVPLETIVELCPQAERLAAYLAGHIAAHGGAALLVDYGDDAENPTGDTLQAVRRHEIHPVFEEPGTADITAHVNFHAIRQATRGYEVAVHGAVPQGLFLSRIGAYARAQVLMQHATPEQAEAIKSGIERLLSPQQMGSLFKMMAISSPTLMPAGF